MRELFLKCKTKDSRSIMYSDTRNSFWVFSEDSDTVIHTQCPAIDDEAMLLV